MKLKATLISIASVLIIGLTAILLYCFWPAIKGTVDNSKYYTQEELQESYDKGYNDGCKTETELTGQVKYYKSLVDEYYIQVNTLNDEITMLTKTKKDYETQIVNIESQKATLQTQVDNLTTIKTNNETTIASLNSQITTLQNQVTNLTNSGADKSEQITILNNQISTLQNTVSQLQTTNDMNVATITSLNTQIANLNTQISDMTLQSQNSQSQINALNNKISELQASVTYYESYIAQLENGEQVVATFEFDGSVYNIQIVNKGSKLSVTTPTSTTYKIFNGWTVNGSKIDLSTFTITTNTKIVADVTYKYDVKFKVDDTVFNSQIITKNNCATLPTNPTEDGYEFDGWSLNGVDVISDITTRQVTQNVTYIAVFTKLHTVTFMSNGNILETKQVRNGEYVSNFDKNYNWTLNETIIDLDVHKIFADVTFVGNLKEFNALENKTWEGLSEISYSYSIWTDGENIYYSSGSDQYVLNKTTNTWEEKTWNGKTAFSGEYIWTDGDNIYLSYGFRNYSHYVLNKATDTWEEKTWNGLTEFNGGFIWTDGENTYYSYNSDQYVLNKTTNTWEEKTWNGKTAFIGEHIWTDGDNIYLSYKQDFVGYMNYVLNKATDTWEEKTWNGLTEFNGGCIWTDGENTYYSYDSDQYVLNKTTNTWEEKTWNGLSNFYGSFIWTDGENTYYSYNSDQYVFVRDYND